MHAPASFRCLFYRLDQVVSVGLIAAKRLFLLQCLFGGLVYAEMPVTPGEQVVEVAEVDWNQSYPAAECACSDECGQNCHGVDDDPGHPRKPHRTLPGDRDLGDCPPLRYQISDCRRAGYPYRIAPWAICARPNT